ncbi:MAG: polysaccharide biosynthesis tyrosine autokinase [Shinella sp.]|nr:polysaccharide biosynthesis tyrosine autokinase [Shinella sp.]
MIWLEAVPANDDAPMPRFLAALMNRKLLLLSCTAAGLAIGLAGYLNAPVRYRSEAVLALDVRKLQALPTESVVSPLPQESPVLRTELDIIGSRMMAERVLALLRSRGVQVEAPGGAESGKVARLSGGQEKETPLPAQSAEDRALVDQLLSNVRVVNDGRSYTIYIAFQGRDPDYAATVANAYGEAYIDYQIDLQTTATKRVSDWLGDKLVSLRDKLEKSERAATSFREQAGIVKSNGTTLLAQQIAGLNAELASLRGKLAGSQARLSTALSALGSDGLALAEVLDSPAIQALRAEEAKIKRDLAEINESGALKNPRLPQLHSQISALRRQIAAEVNQIVNSLRNEIDVNRRQQEGVEASLREMQGEMASASQALVQADQLDREASANRAIYESYLTRYKQTIEQDGLAAAEARMISRAMPSDRPYSPDLLTWLLGGFLLGTSGGLGAIFLLELRRSLRLSPEAIEQKSGVPVIGKIPELSPAERQRVQALVRDGRSPFARVLADLQGYLKLLDKPGSVPAIAIASAEDGEGKTFVAASLARSLAAAGIRPVIVDANLRNPGVGREFYIQPSAHLEQAIRDDFSLDGIIQSDHSSRVDMVCAKTSEAPSEFIIGNDKFPKLIAELKRRYDLVLIDMPSAASGFDMMRIAALADTTLVVVRDEDARVAKAMALMRRMRAAGQSIGGVILNGVARRSLQQRLMFSPVSGRPALSWPVRRPDSAKTEPLVAKI